MIIRKENEPLDGIFAIPAQKNRARYDVAKAYEYCKKNNKKPKDLTEQEKKAFVIK